jgi:hypothetical protein
MSAEPIPLYGPEGEACPTCRAPLAGDQRYCLHCGARRPEARLAFADVLEAEALESGAAVHARAVATPAGGRDGWLRANAPTLALAGLLLGTLLVGVLIGHWATASSPATRTPPVQVIRVAGAAAPAASSTSGSADASTAATSTRGAASDTSASAASSTKGATDIKAVKGGSKAIDKLVKKGKPITTGGAPPPKDNKPAGSGTGFQTIG